MSKLGVLALVALLICSCLGKFAWTISAPPLARAVALIENDADVAAALGEKVSVSLAVGRSLSRDVLRKLQGSDVVSVHTTARGTRGEAVFTLRAQNIGAQGWAGTFSVRQEGRPVLREQGYVQQGARVLLEGDFAPDGTPRIKGR